MRVKKQGLSGHKAAKDRREEFYDPARRDNMLEPWEELLMDPNVALDKSLQLLENPHWGWCLVQASASVECYHWDGSATSLVTLVHGRQEVLRN